MRSLTGTDIGLVRSVNQDMCFASDEPIGPLPNLYLLADGMGGHAAGEFAASFTIRNFVRLAKQREASFGMPLQTYLSALAMEVNGMLYEESSRPGAFHGTGTTLVAACVENGVLDAINIGDSRLYRVGEELTQVTLDHSVSEEMVRRGETERGSDLYWEKKNQITRAVGPARTVLVDTFALPLHEGEGILLCSDGLTNMLSDEEILSVIHAYPGRDADSLAHIREDLLEAAKAAGGTDNITFVYVWPEQAADRA